MEGLNPEIKPDKVQFEDEVDVSLCPASGHEKCPGGMNEAEGKRQSQTKTVWADGGVGPEFPSCHC